MENNTNKLAFIDIGELGWSLYLSAHINWLKSKNIDTCVITFPDRFCLYEDKATLIKEVCLDYYKRYANYSQDGFGLYGVSGTELKQFFANKIPSNYHIPSYFKFSCNHLNSNKFLFCSYKYTKSITKIKRILIFPRYRETYYPKKEMKIKHPLHYEKRNLPKKFYTNLIIDLCKTFSEYKITTIGTKNGAYNFDEITNSNFEDLVGKTKSLQEVINYCKESVVTIGGTSSLPKIAMLQKVPSIIIGHEKQRFEKDENWLKTPILFHEIKLEDYNSFNNFDCIEEIRRFIKKYETN